jgi:hypothetical protein
MNQTIAVLVVVAISLAACATTKEWAATGGSRADGTVKLSYEYGAFETPSASPEQALALAASKCSVWGYSGAEPFGGALSTCTNHNGYGNCVRWLVTAEYQCAGAPK